jgi:hypothetical protein
MEKEKEWGLSHIYGNRHRRIKCLKNVSKLRSHENCDISGILQYLEKILLDSEKGMDKLHFLSISLFFKAEYTAKNYVNGGGEFGFS